MFAQAISSISGPARHTSSRTESASSAGGFSGILTQQMGGEAKVDALDEDKALKELFHILAMLSLGQVDDSVFSEQEASAGTTPGPTRTEVENLKEVIRRLMGGGRTQGSATDPESTSLSALFQSLPTEIQNLLRRAFPSADRIMAEETQKLLAGLKA